MLHMQVSVQPDIEGVGLKVEEENVDLNVQEYVREEVITSDYEKLDNKPRLNGVEIIGDMNETDPTVPAWAKTPDKPKYRAEEVDGLDVIEALTLSEINELWNSVM